MEHRGVQVPEDSVRKFPIRRRLSEDLSLDVFALTACGDLGGTSGRERKRFCTIFDHWFFRCAIFRGTHSGRACLNTSRVENRRTEF